MDKADDILGRWLELREIIQKVSHWFQDTEDCLTALPNKRIPAIILYLCKLS